MEAHPVSGRSSCSYLAGPCVDLSGADQVHVDCRPAPPWRLSCHGALSLWYLRGSFKGRTSPAPCCPWQHPASLPRCSLTISLCPWASEEGAWPPGSSWCCPESVSWLKGTRDTRRWKPQRQCPPEVASSPCCIALQGPPPAQVSCRVVPAAHLLGLGAQWEQNGPEFPKAFVGER